MSRGLGRGRYVWGTYPEPSSSSSGPPDVFLPFSNLAYVDLGTTTPVPSQTGSVKAPFSTIQRAVDAGFTAVYLTGGFSSETVTATAAGLFLTGANGTAGFDELVLPDNGSAQFDSVSVGAITAGNACIVISNSTVGNVTFGDSGFLILNGPGALDFSAKVDQLVLANLTMGPGGTLIATNTVISSNSAIVANTIELFGCSSVAASMTCDTLDAQSTLLVVGDYTTTSVVSLQNVRASAPVSFINAIGQEFQLDGFSNYWIKRNAVTFSHIGEKVITDDITP